MKSSLFLLVFASLAWSAAQEPAAAQGNPSSLDLSKFPGLVLEDVIIPIPSEVFGVLDKLGDPDWKTELNLGPRHDFTDRRDVALLLGTTVADGFVAVQAEDIMSIETVGKEVLNLARILGIKDAVNEHCSTIATAAKKQDWPKVRNALDATQATVKERMTRMKDANLAECVSVGGWLRGTQVITSVIGKSYSAERAELLHQPDLAQYFRDSVEELRAQNPSVEKFKLISSGLAQMQQIMAGDVTKLDPESVATLLRISSDLVNRIQSKS